MTIEPQEDQTLEQEQYVDQEPDETRHDETEAPKQSSYEDQPVSEPEPGEAASYASVLADHISNLDDFIQQRLWSKIQSYGTQKLPPATALNLAVRAIEAELRN